MLPSLVSSFFFACLLFIDPAFALLEGAPLLGKPDLVRIRFMNGWICSGFYVDHYTILTAAHCLVPTEKLVDLKVSHIESVHDSILPVEILGLIPHPNFKSQSWPAFDIGIIKTSQNKKFEGNFQIAATTSNWNGHAILFGCGRTAPTNPEVNRSQGKNFYIRLNSVLFFIGNSSSEKNTGQNVSIAPNDSGGPIIATDTHQVIGVATTTTVGTSKRYHLPTLSTGTSTETNRDFINSHLGDTQNKAPSEK